MSKYLTLPDGRPRHFTGKFATITHRGRQIRAHLDTLADRSVFVSNVFGDIGTCEVVAVPDAIEPAGIDGFLCLVYSDDPPPGSFVPTMDCCAFFDATPAVWRDLDAWAIKHVTPEDVCAHFVVISEAVARHHFEILVPKLWQKIHRIRQPATVPPEPKFPEAYRKITLVMSMPLEYYSVHALVLERRRRRSEGRFISPSPRLKESLVNAILQDDIRLILSAMGAEGHAEIRAQGISALRKIYINAHRISKKTSVCAKYAMTYHGQVFRGADRGHREEIAPPVLPTTASISGILRFVLGTDANRYSAYTQTIRFTTIDEALQVRDNLASLFWDLPPRLDHFCKI